MFHERPKSLRFELHRSLGNVRLAFFEIDLHRFVKRLAREFASRLGSVLALLDLGDAALDAGPTSPAILRRRSVSQTRGL